MEEFKNLGHIAAGLERRSRYIFLSYLFAGFLIKGLGQLPFISYGVLKIKYFLGFW